nr:hypothetical protein [Tanacetum cinerariifolium]
MEYLEQTEKELNIEFNKSLQEQDPLDELNDLANKKRKRTDDSTDHSRLFVYLNMGILLGLVLEPFSPLVLRRLGSILTSVYAAIQKLKKAFDFKRPTTGAPRAAKDAPAAGEGAHAVPALTRVSTWMISCMTQLIDASGRTYQAFDSTFVGSSRLPYQRRVRPRIGDASTSAALHTINQPDP